MSIVQNQIIPTNTVQWQNKLTRTGMVAGGGGSVGAAWKLIGEERALLRPLPLFVERSTFIANLLYALRADLYESKVLERAE